MNRPSPTPWVTRVIRHSDVLPWASWMVARASMEANYLARHRFPFSGSGASKSPGTATGRPRVHHLCLRPRAHPLTSRCACSRPRSTSMVQPARGLANHHGVTPASTHKPAARFTWLPAPHRKSSPPAPGSIRHCDATPLARPILERHCPASVYGDLGSPCRRVTS